MRLPIVERGLASVAAVEQRQLMSRAFREVETEVGEDLNGVRERLVVVFLICRECSLPFSVDRYILNTHSGAFTSRRGKINFYCMSSVAGCGENVSRAEPFIHLHSNILSRPSDSIERARCCSTSDSFI